MAEVKFDNVTKRYGEKEAIAGLSCTATQGEFLVLFGPSGAGKTTTLHCVAGLVEPDEGEIYFDGKPMREVDTADRNVAMAFENYALYPHMSVFENIAFPMQIPGRRTFSRDDIKRRVTEIAKLLQIDMLLERRPQQLSGGQRQRVALARCLVREPDVCLLDEPIAHLDAKLRHRMYAELKRIQREREVTTIYATPAQTEAMAMADRIVILFEGQMQQIATPRELYERPASVAIARFGGEQPMNILPVEIGRENGQIFYTLSGHRVQAPQRLVQIVQENNLSDKVLLGIRPPDIDLLTGSADESCLPVTLYAVEQLGRTARLTVQSGEHLIEVAAKPDLAHLDWEVGETIWLSLARSPLYVFDAETSWLVGTSGTEEA